jgi:predicted dinucleotide-binding enzyme
MALKKTIAIVGATDKKGTEIANDFAFMDYRLLLVSDNMNKISVLSKSLFEKGSTAEIDTVECVKDGCWEADIIILAVDAEQKKMVAEMMKEVATQKIVVVVSESDNEHQEIQQVLPHSKLVSATIIENSKEIILSGNDEWANKEISNIFLKAGYRLIKNSPVNNL